MISFRRPELYLAALVFLVALTALDLTRSPNRQLTVRLCTSTIRAYQHYGRTWGATLIRCRYVPTCSEYSLQAIEKYGAGRGFVLSIRRLWSCRGGVPIGTLQPVP